MELVNEFTVNVPVDEAWAVLTDLERIAPCLPGAELREVEGDEYRGVVKVKVGPITAQYQGIATFEERDATAHRAVIRAEGRETRGQGNASAVVSASLDALSGGATIVRVVTDLNVTGRVAQFGRGVMATVSTTLIGQFVEALEADVLSASGDAAVGSAGSSPMAGDIFPSNGSGPPGGARRLTPRPAEPVDVLAVAGTPTVKRAARVLAAVVLVLLLLRHLARR